MANDPGDSNPFGASVGKKFNLDLRAHGQIRDGKQTHSDIAEIDAEGIEVMRSAEYANGCVQQLTLAPAPVWLGVESERHWLYE